MSGNSCIQKKGLLQQRASFSKSVWSSKGKKLLQLPLGTLIFPHTRFLASSPLARFCAMTLRTLLKMMTAGQFILTSLLQRKGSSTTGEEFWLRIRIFHTLAVLQLQHQRRSTSQNASHQSKRCLFQEIAIQMQKALWVSLKKVTDHIKQWSHEIQFKEPLLEILGMPHLLLVLSNEMAIPSASPCAVVHKKLFLYSRSLYSLHIYLEET